MAVSEAQTENPTGESVRVVLELALREEDQLADRANWLDTKTAAVVGFVIVSVGELLGFLFLASTEKAKFNVSHAYLLAALFFMGLVALLVASLFGLFGLKPMGFKFGASAEMLAPHMNEAEINVRLLALESLQRSISTNRKIVDRKASRAKITVIFVAIALVFFAVSLTILFLSLF